MLRFVRKYTSVLAYLFLALSVLAVFWQAHDFLFVGYDDDCYVYENQHVLNGLSGDSIKWVFTTSYFGYWQPLTWLSLMLNCQLFGPGVGSFHLVNVLLHLANTLLLFALLRKMTGSLWPGAFVAAAFALHPMHVESVAWIAERKDVLSTLFLLLSMLAYAAYVKRPSVSWYMVSLALFALGLLAKPMLVTLPFLLLLLDCWPLNRFRKDTAYRMLVEKVPFFLTAAVFSVITYITQQKGGGLTDVRAVPLAYRIENAVMSYASYIGKMLWPQNLSVHYPLALPGSQQWWQVALCVLLLAAITFVAIKLWRRAPYLAVGWLWFVGTLIPVIGLVRFTGSAYADRFTYIPYIGLFIMLAWGLSDLLARWPQRRLISAVFAVLALTALGVVAQKQAGYWKDSITLFSHAIDVTQDNYLAYNNRGAIYNEIVNYEKAVSDFTQAIKIKPDNSEAYNNRGISYIRLGRPQDAIPDLYMAVKIKPDFPDAHYNLGVSYSKLGNTSEAIRAYQKAVEIKNDYTEAHQNLANELKTIGRYDEAQGEYRSALRIKPDSLDSLNNLAWLIATNPHIRNRDTGEAVRLAEHACRLTNYTDPAILDTLAAAYASSGMFAQAKSTAEKGLGLAETGNLTKIIDSIRQHLSLYQQGRPYIEPANSPR